MPSDYCKLFTSQRSIDIEQLIKAGVSLERVSVKADVLDLARKFERRTR